MSVNFPLKTDYQDDILDLTQNSQRCFEEIINTDGSKSFRDVTAYEREGDNYGASVINVQNEAINELHDSSTQMGETINEIDTKKANLSLLQANGLTAQLTVQNGKYGFVINGVFYQIGAINMRPNFSNKLADCSNGSTITINRDAFLVGTVGNFASVTINGYQIVKTRDETVSLCLPVKANDKILVSNWAGQDTDIALHVFGVLS